MRRTIGLPAFVLLAFAATGAELPHFERMMFNNPGLETDLSLGIWPHVAAYDYDGDGKMDVVLRASGCPIKGSERRQLCRAYSDPLVPKAGVDVPVSASRQPDPRRHPDANGVKCPHPRKPNGLRANWVDLDSDGREDLVYTVSDWAHYGKVGPQCPVAYDSRGVWTNGQIETYMYFIRNLGGANVWKPQWAEPVPVVAQGDSGDVLKGPWGGDRVMFWDFDGDGDMDFIAGEFVDSFWYFENVAGKGNPPKFAKGRKVLDADGRPLAVDLCMYDPVLVDFTGDRRPDIVAADEDGRTALYENAGTFRNGVPVFRCGRYFRQKAQELKFGCLATPCGTDWDGDGDWDFIVGNSAGYIAFIENLSGPGVEHPSWAEPRYLTVGGRPVRTMAGWSNSPQGPAERKWGYSSVSVGDWDEDGILDVVSNDINGDVLFYRGRKRGGLEMEPARPIEVEWPECGQPQPNWEWRGNPGKRLRAQWRTTAEIRDWTGDGHLDLITLDFEGYLALYERFRGKDGKLRLKAPTRCFVSGKGEPIRFSGGERGGSGRARFCSVDWDGDGRMDFLQAAFNARLLRQRGEQDGVWSFDVCKRIGEEQLQGHTCCPTTVDFNADGVPDCVIAAEDGYFYYLRNPRASNAGTCDNSPKVCSCF